MVFWFGGYVEMKYLYIHQTGGDVSIAGTI